MALADELKETSAKAEALREEAALSARLADQIVREQEEAQWQVFAEKRFADEVEPALRAAANEGKRSCRINIVQWGREITARDRTICKRIRELLSEHGLSSREMARSLSPNGSDPLFDHTAYDLDIEVNW